MLNLDIEVNRGTVKQPDAARLVKFSGRRGIASSPVKAVQLSYGEEQMLYDRMYESEVWKNGHFFGYRSKVNQRWHDDDESTAVARAERVNWMGICEFFQVQGRLEDEHAEFLQAKDEQAAERERHKRLTRG